MYHDYPEDRLLNLLQNSIHQAFEEIYRRNFETLYAQAFSIIKDEELASDIIQDVFLYLWTHRDIAIKTSLSAYLGAMTRHAVLKVIRHQKVVNRFREYLAHEVSCLPIDPEHNMMNSELGDLIDAEIGKLPPRMREVFELKYIQENSNKEIALALDISSNTVKNQTVSSLKILRGKLKKISFFISHLLTVTFLS